MGIFKDDDDVNEDLLSGFDDANVDKDLLSQIFADSGSDDDDDALEKALAEDSALDGDLDDLLSEIETIEESAKASAAKENEKKSGNDAGKFGKASGKKSNRKENKKEDKPAEPEKIVETENPAEPEGAGETADMSVTPAASVTAGDDNIEKEEEKKEEKADMSIPVEHGDGTLTVISEGTTINGGISTKGNLEVSGTVNGDIEAKGKVVVIGAVMGSVVAADIEVDTPRLEGSLNSEGNVQIGKDTVVIGDVTGVSATIAGAVKGAIDINGSMILEETARIKGDIKARSIRINEGAFMDGHCVLSYADVDIDSIFGDSKADNKKSEDKKPESEKKSESEKK